MGSKWRHANENPIFRRYSISITIGFDRVSLVGNTGSEIIPVLNP